MELDCNPEGVDYARLKIVGLMYTVNGEWTIYFDLLALYVLYVVRVNR